MAVVGPDILKALIQSDAALALARAEIDALNETLWFVRADGYRKAVDGAFTLSETGIVEWNEARRWRLHNMIELTAQAIYEGIPADLDALINARYVNFRGIAWTPVSVQPRAERYGGTGLGARSPAFFVEGRRTLEIDLIATADPASTGAPAPKAPPKMTRELYQELTAGERTGPPVMLENGMIGMANHEQSDVILVDAYQGNEHMGVFRIPYANLIHMGGNAFVASLAGVPEPTGAEGERK